MDNPFFKEGDQLVYVVWYDNMESYEDRYQYIEAIFSSWDEAERYINDTYGDYKNFKCERVHTYAIALDIFNKPPTTSVLDWTFSDDWADPRVTIEIWNLTTGKQVYWDDEHILLVEGGNRIDNTSYNEEGIGSINPSEADTE